MNLKSITIALFLLATFTLSAKEIKSFSINPIEKTSILPGDDFVFVLTVTYTDDKQKKIKSNSAKFREDYTVATDGCSFFDGKLVVNKLRKEIPNNKITFTVTSKEKKELVETKTLDIAYFKKITVKNNRSYLEIGDKLDLIVEVTTNTNEVIQLTPMSYARKWDWFTVTTSRGAIFSKGSLVVTKDVRQLICDTILLTITPEGVDSLQQKVLFLMDYKETVYANHNVKAANDGAEGGSSKASGANGTDGRDGGDGAKANDLAVYMKIHPCNKNLLKIELRDLVTDVTEQYIINKNEGKLIINCFGGHGGRGGDGSNGNKGAKAKKTRQPQDGGHGGNGGNGGNSGDGGKVTIYTTLGATPYVLRLQINNEAGFAGKAGKKGKGKDGGKGNDSFSEGHAGADGIAGTKGTRGEAGGKPTIETAEIEFDW